MAVGTIVELAIPLTDLGLAAAQPVSFFVAVYDGRGAEIERHPADRAIELAVPDASFDASHWRV